MSSAHLLDGVLGPSAPAAAIRDVIMQFGETTALNRVSFDLARGKVTAIVGANGSGKSTLLKVLAGALNPTDGGIVGPHGGRVANVPTALAEGIALVPQEPTVAGHLAVWQNIMLGRSDASQRGFLRDRHARVLATDAIDGLLPASILDAPASTLSKSTLQLIQIAAAIAKEPELLLLDEPTAVLDEDGVEALHRLIRRLIDRGRSVVIVSHRLRDVLELADNIVALAAGNAVYNGAAASHSQHEILTLMSSEAKPRAATERTAPTDVVLQAMNIRGLRGLNIDSLSVRSGEIVGIAGQSGSGRSRLAAILGGAYSAEGQVQVNGREIRLGSVTSAKAHGVAYVPEDRQGCAMMANQTAAQNMILGRRDANLHRGPFRRRRAERANALQLMEQFDVRPAEPDRPGALFSGGNQQKLVIARALSWGPEVVVVDEPTQGVDREARQIIHDGLFEAASRGAAVVAVCSEFDELFDLADRIVVLRDGEIVLQGHRDEITADDVLAVSLGAHHSDPDFESTTEGASHV
ncbi:ATP-binding cassette domain-containing protein [Nocardioides alcanivorans]|uniref:ATP-binding cassette domain-containing protein n=1 Tax=Nocardioides alcanivorans TaxID=2897352 RepID=UPI001F27CC37|nr:sugar ABC transporter ATP-binding protein [Nocardioides alcanivorans]